MLTRSPKAKLLDSFLVAGFSSNNLKQKKRNAKLTRFISKPLPRVGANGHLPLLTICADYGIMTVQIIPSVIKLI
jgi:hypothetical protein